jgi:hypothetical protein
MATTTQVSGLKPAHIATVLFVALGVLLGARSLATIAADWTHILADAHDSWAAMTRALETVHGPASDDLYQALFFQAGVKFQYSPTSLLTLDALSAVMPLSNIALNILNAGFYLLNAVLLGAVAFTAFSRADAGSGLSPRIAAALGFASAFAFFPLLRAFEIGQIQIWLDTGITAACLLFLLDRRFLAGMIVAAIVAIKPQFGLLLLWGLAWRQWSFVAGFLALGLPLAGASIALYGLHNHLAYLDVLSFISRHGESFYGNHSVNGILHRLLQNGPILTFDSNAFAPYHPVVYVGTVIAGFTLPLLPLAIGLLSRGQRAGALDFGMACICFTMAAPVAWEHHYGILLPFFIVALAGILIDAPQAERPALLAGWSLAWFLVASRIPFLAVTAGTVLNIVFAHIFFGACILLWVMWRASAPYRVLSPGLAAGFEAAAQAPAARTVKA